jgi:hypothetical protein
MRHLLEQIDLEPGSLPDVERSLGEATAGERGGPEPASFRTEIGPLNRIVRLLRGAGVEASEARGATPPWPEAALAHVRARTAEPFEPLPFSPELEIAGLGPWFELRIYEAVAEEDLARMARAWEAALPARLERGPLAAVWRSPPGGARRWLHLWPYCSLDERAELRRSVRADGIWPPPLVARRLGLPAWRVARQESWLLVRWPRCPASSEGRQAPGATVADSPA